MFSRKPSAVSFSALLFYLICIICMYLCAFTVLSPFLALLILSSILREKVFLFLWFSILRMDKVSYQVREKTFEMLKEELPNFGKEFLQVLEIGVGCDSIEYFYTENHRITLLCKNKSYLKSIQRKFKKNTDLKYEEIQDEENLPPNSEEAYDVVTSTFCLCSVTDVDHVLREIIKVLRPGGKFIFVEHVGFPSNQLAYFLQKLATPIWKIFFNRCNLDRHVVKNIKKAGFSTISYKTYYKNDHYIFLRPIVVGLCVK